MATKVSDDPLPENATLVKGHKRLLTRNMSMSGIPIKATPGITTYTMVSELALLQSSNVLLSTKTVSL